MPFQAGQINRANVPQLQLGGHANNVGVLGGHRVQPGAGETIKRAFQKAFADIKSFFQSLPGLPGRIKAAHQERVHAARVNTANNRAESFVSKFLGGPVTPGRAATMAMSLLKAAQKLNPDDPASKMIELLDTARNNLSETDRVKFDRLPWNTISVEIEQVTDQRLDEGNRVMEGLAQMGQVDQPVDPEGEKNHTLQTLDRVMTHVRTEATNGIAQRAAVVQSKMPHGVNVDGQGRVTGTLNLNNVPADNVGLPTNWRGGTMQNAMHCLMTDSMHDHFTGNVDGVQVTSQSTKDLWRMDYNMHLPNGTIYNSHEDPTKGEGPRRKAVMDQLRTFTGNNPTAIGVLSSILTQQTLTPLHESLLNATGGVQHLAFARQNDAKITRANGQTEGLGNTSVYGAAKMDLSRTPGGDYQITIDWPVYFNESGKGFGKSALPMKDGEVLEAHFRATIVVDATQAALGNAVVNLPTPPTVTFDGRVDV